jgi:ABC-type bacteriocin/lantibiotic exporter with double-glycine peptidase domain
VIILVITYITNPFFGLIFTIFLPLVVLSTRIQGKRLAELQKNAMIKQDDFLGTLKNIVDNKREIYIIKENDYFNDVFTNKMDLWTKFVLKFRFNQYLMEKIPSIIASVYNVLFLFIGALFISMGKLTPGLLIMAYQYLGMISTPVSRVSEILIRLKANKEHIDRIESFSSSRETINKISSIEEPIININNLIFYKDIERKDFLFSIDQFFIPPNGLYVIKGQNGTGKSLFLNYLLGFIDKKCAEGQIELSKNLEDRSAFLTYPIFFINGSFEDNLFSKYADQGLLDELNIDFADKNITTNPINLSLGQQQKMALLRVLSMDYDFLFLDEPLSNLDEETQIKVKDYIKIIKENKVVVAVMHDTMFDDIADKIFRIQDQKMNIVF